jgi:hypothetical protein
MGIDASHILHKLCGFHHGGQILEVVAFSKVFQVCQAFIRNLSVQKSCKNYIWIP